MLYVFHRTFQTSPQNFNASYLAPTSASRKKSSPRHINSILTSPRNMATHFFPAKEKNQVVAALPIRFEAFNVLNQENLGKHENQEMNRVDDDDVSYTRELQLEQEQREEQGYKQEQLHKQDHRQQIKQQYQQQEYEQPQENEQELERYEDQDHDETVLSELTGSQLQARPNSRLSLNLKAFPWNDHNNNNQKQQKFNQIQTLNSNYKVISPLNTNININNQSNLCSSSNNNGKVKTVAYLDSKKMTKAQYNLIFGELDPNGISGKTYWMQSLRK